MGNKVGLITPFLMLLAGALASVIMYIKGYSLYRMSWGLLIVLLIFYVIGDIVRYLYTLIRPRIIPNIDVEGVVMRSDSEENDQERDRSRGKEKEIDGMEALEPEGADFEESAYGMDEDGMAAEGYSEEDLAERLEAGAPEEGEDYEEDSQNDVSEGYEGEEEAY